MFHSHVTIFCFDGERNAHRQRVRRNIRESDRHIVNAIATIDCGSRSIARSRRHPLRPWCANVLAASLFAANLPWHVLCKEASMSTLNQTLLFSAPQVRAIARSIAGCATALLIALTSLPAQSQIVFNEMAVTFTLEAYGNTTAGATTGSTSTRGAAPDAVSFDGAARVLARLAPLIGPDIGA